MKAINKLYPNTVVQFCHLYFNKQIDGVRYTAPFGLRDTRTNRKKAGLIANQINADVLAGTFDANDYPILAKYHKAANAGDYPTFGEYADEWLDSKLNLAPATFRTYKHLVKKHLLPDFEDVPLNEITKKRIEKWLIGKKATLTCTYANECLRRLKSVLGEAEINHDLNFHLSRIKPLRNYEVAEPVENLMFTLEECSKMYLVMNPRLRTMMLCSMFAGLRTGEVIALKREDVDFQNEYLQVRATMSEGERKTPKTISGVRKIRMHPVLKQHLLELLASHEHDFVFISQRGKPMKCRQNFDKEYKRSKEAAGVRDIRWYGFRKLFASLRYACTDAVPNSIAKEMGHKKASMTLDTYSEAIDHLGVKFEEIQFPILPSLQEHSCESKVA